MMNPEQGGELNPADRMIFDADRKALQEAEAARGMKGKLESRLTYGLDPAAMMIVPDTKEHTDRIAEVLGADPDVTWPLIEELHVTGPWRRADQLQSAEDPNIRYYLALAASCRERGKEGYAPDAYMQDRARIVDELSTFEPDMLEERVAWIKERVDLEEVQEVDVDGHSVEVPVAAGDVALPLAIQGYKGCVAVAGENFFAQTFHIDDAILTEQGLTPGFAEVFDASLLGGETPPFRRVALDSPEAPDGRMVWIDAGAEGDLDDLEPRAKRIADGYVLAYGDKELAVDLVASSIQDLEAEQA